MVASRSKSDDLLGPVKFVKDHTILTPTKITKNRVFNIALKSSHIFLCRIHQWNGRCLSRRQANSFWFVPLSFSASRRCLLLIEIRFTLGVVYDDRAWKGWLRLTIKNDRTYLWEYFRFHSPFRKRKLQKQISQRLTFLCTDPKRNKDWVSSDPIKSIHWIREMQNGIDVH